MKRTSKALVAACVLLPGLALAQGGPPGAAGGQKGPGDINNSLVSDIEMHVVRGLLERANTSMGYARIALTKSSSDSVKKAAQGYIDAMTKLNEDLRATGLKLKIDGISGMPPGGAPGAGAGGPGGPGGPGGAGAPGGAGGPAGAAGPGGPPGGGAGGPPGGGGMARTGPGVYAARFTEELNKLSGDQFDEIYELRTLEYVEDMERTLLSESLTGATAALRDWAKANAQGYENQGQVFGRLAFGESGGPGGPGAPGGGAPPSGGTPPAR